MTRSQQSRQWLNDERMSIRREVDYIVRRAAEYDARVVTLGSLVLFSTLGLLWPPSPAAHPAPGTARGANQKRRL